MAISCMAAIPNRPMERKTTANMTSINVKPASLGFALRFTVWSMPARLYNILLLLGHAIAGIAPGDLAGRQDDNPVVDRISVLKIQHLSGLGASSRHIRT